MLRTDSIEDVVSPLLNVLAPLEEIEYQLMPHLVPYTLAVRCDEAGDYIWGIRYGTMVPTESAPFSLLLGTSQGALLLNHQPKPARCPRCPPRGN